MGYTSTVKLKVVVQLPPPEYCDDPIELISVEYLEEQEPRDPKKMSDTDALRAEFANTGEELFWSKEDRPEYNGDSLGFITITGVLWWESTNTPDCGEDWDCGFEIAELW